ncbi:MAG: GNAT family N-acetyltransferase [Thaumarchaeota archaeon]|nr:GNAT family N-acetyltransferase [Nitrososphaerota archaeon]
MKSGGRSGGTPNCSLVARKGRRIEGTFLGTWDGRRGWVYHLAVRDTSRRTGVATMLLEELESRIRKKGVLKMNAMVYLNNEP